MARRRRSFSDSRWSTERDEGGGGEGEEEEEVAGVAMDEESHRRQSL